MIATIAKRFTFDAAHQLLGLPPEHKCRRMHGHTYTVELVFLGPVDLLTGFVVDYQAIADAWQPLHDILDHQYLNDIVGLGVPSTEYLAWWIAVRIALTPAFSNPAWCTTLLKSVRVEESSTTWCEVAIDEIRNWENRPIYRTDAIR